jgi:hypothetical protein
MRERPSGFEEAAGDFMPQIMKVEVDGFERGACRDASTATTARSS